MTHDRILSRLVERLRGTFGDFVAVRDLRRTRRVEGDAWCATLAVATSAEELILGEFDVGEDGTLTTPLTVDAVLAAVRRAPVLITEAGLRDSRESLSDILLDPADDDAYDAALDSSSSAAIYEAAIA